MSRFVCAGCGAVARDPCGFRCPNAGAGDDIDHVLRRELDPNVPFPWGDSEPNPFIRFRRLLHAWHLGLPDEDFVALVRRLDARLRAVDGGGFIVTPFARSDELSDRLGFSSAGGVWVKDETRNVSGSHKARHLFGVLLYLECCEALGLTAGRRELAIASCGNAALAAAVVAAAGGRALRIFVPVATDPAVLARLEQLGAEVEVCPRMGEPGDPAYRRLLSVLQEGALPFTCQGSLNGLAVEGGHTLGWELAAARIRLDRVLVQVGGGALASAVAAGLREGGLRPRLETVQSAGTAPLRRAFDALAATGLDVRYAGCHRSEFMWPWESGPRSVAHGILDDETYDWLAVIEAMRESGGRPWVVDEEMLLAANELARSATGIDVDHTGTAGLAGLIALRKAGAIGEDERVAVLFTGVTREAGRDEEPSGARHPATE